MTARFTPDGGSGGGGGEAVATAAWSEDASTNDALVAGVLLAEDATVEDALVAGMLLAEDASVADAWTALLIPSWAEDATVNDLAKLVLLNVDATRTGSPDTDVISDGWTDQASAATNHGNESLLVKGKATVADDERRAHLQIDLTNYTSMTTSGTGLSLTFRAATSSAVLADTLTWSAAAGSGTTRPFTESSLAWTGQPANAGGLGTGSVSVAIGAAQSFTITITPTNLASALGHWLLITFTMASAAAPNTVTINSRDDATAANRPKFTIDYLQRGT